MKDNINPNHYKNGKIEAIDAIEAATVNKLGIEAVCVANVIKYLWRYEEKNGLEDIEKAHWYLQKLITHYNENIRKNNELEQSDVRVPTESPEDQEGQQKSPLQELLRELSKHTGQRNASPYGGWYCGYTSTYGGSIDYETDS